jgi:hypothetical protein
MASVTMQLGRPKRSLGYLRRLDALNAVSADYLFQATAAFLEKGAIEPAREAYNMAVENGLPRTLQERLINRYPDLLDTTVTVD